MKAVITITGTLDMHHADVKLLERAGAEQALNTLRMHGAKVELTIDAKRRAPAAKSARMVTRAPEPITEQEA